MGRSRAALLWPLPLVLERAGLAGTASEKPATAASVAGCDAPARRVLLLGLWLLGELSAAASERVCAAGDGSREEPPLPALPSRMTPVAPSLTNSASCLVADSVSDSTISPKLQSETPATVGIAEVAAAGRVSPRAGALVASVWAASAAESGG